MSSRCAEESDVLAVGEELDRKMTNSGSEEIKMRFSSMPFVDNAVGSSITHHINPRTGRLETVCYQNRGWLMAYRGKRLITYLNIRRWERCGFFYSTWSYLWEDACIFNLVYRIFSSTHQSWTFREFGRMSRHISMVWYIHHPPEALQDTMKAYNWGHCIHWKWDTCPSRCDKQCCALFMKLTCELHVSKPLKAFRNSITSVYHNLTNIFSINKMSLCHFWVSQLDSVHINQIVI